MAADDALSRGVAEYLDESYEEASATLEKVYLEQPDSYEVVFYLGMSYLRMLEFEKARTFLLKASDMHPSDGMLAVSLGEAFFSLRDYPAAERSLQGAIDSGVISARAQYFLGLTRYSSGKYRRALENFEQAVRLDPGMQAKASYLIGLVYRKLGEEAASVEALKTVMSLAPGSDEAARAEAVLKQPFPRNYHLSASLTEQYDSNVVLKPARNVSGLIVTRSRDYVTTAAVNATYGEALDDASGFSASYGFSQSLHRKLSFYDVQSHHVEITPYTRQGSDQAFMTVSADGVGVDYRRYMLGFGLMPGYTKDFGDNQQGSLVTGFQRKMFFWPDASGADNRDANNYLVGLTYSWGAPQQGLILGDLLTKQGSSLSVSYFLDSEKAGGANWSYTGHRVSLSGNYPLREDLRLNLSADHYRQRYPNLNTFYGVVRHDMTTTLSSVVEWTPMDWATLKASYSFTRVLSNISVYDYRRNLGSLSFECRY